jgi:hypothetical protein
MGIASGTNSSLREIGGVFGIAVLASVFSSSDVFTSVSVFVDHFTDAVWVGATFSAIGILAAASLPRRGYLAAAPTRPSHGAELAVVGEVLR